MLGLLYNALSSWILAGVSRAYASLAGDKSRYVLGNVLASQDKQFQDFMQLVI